MGINIDGARDLLTATDGSLTIEGQSINSTGIGTFSGGVKVGTAATIHSTGQFNIGVAATIFANGNATFAGIVTAASFSGATALTGSTNNTVVTVTGSNAIQGEANLTYDGNSLSQAIDANDEGINITGSGAHSARLKVDTNQSGADDTIFFQSARWNSNEVASIHFRTGTDTTNKDDGRITFHTTTSGSTIAERLRIREDGRISIASSLAVAGVCTAAAFVPSEGQLSNRRININGAMQVWQRSTSASDIGGSNGYFACDRYRSSNNGNARYTMSRDTDEPGGFNYSMKIDVTTAVASPSPNNYTFIQHRMTGSDVQPFAKGTSSAQKYALSFWVKSPKTGVHVVQLEDVENSRSVQGTYTIASADTWEKHTIIFPAETSNGISGDNANRMCLYFWLYAGSTYNNGNVNSLGTTWDSTGSISRASGQVNCFDNTSNNFYITGIQFEVGSYATPFEHLSYGDELARCQRYYEALYMNAGTHGFQSATSYGGQVSNNIFAVTKRAQPTFSLEGNASWVGATPNAFTDIHNFIFHHGSTAFTMSDSSQDLCGSFSCEL